MTTMRRFSSANDLLADKCLTRDDDLQGLTPSLETVESWRREAEAARYISSRGQARSNNATVAKPSSASSVAHNRKAGRNGYVPLSQQRAGDAADDDINASVVGPTTTMQNYPTGFIAQFGGQGPEGRVCLEEVRTI
eukprot:9445312-Pyramimonas_sp.AAC.1